MNNDSADAANLRQQAETRHEIEARITRMFAPEDEGLRSALRAGQEAGLPEIQISAIQGKFLYLLAKACNAKKILEIGSLAGYSGIWLARALPQDGRLISLELDPKHAEIIRGSFQRAGVGERTEVRVGKALELLPQLANEAPFDLTFIDADKTPYPQYLAWALQYSRPGSIIVADNTIRDGRALVEKERLREDDSSLFEYNQRASSDPRLTSLAFAIDTDYTDGFTVSVVQAEA